MNRLSTLSVSDCQLEAVNSLYQKLCDHSEYIRTELLRCFNCTVELGKDDGLVDEIITQIASATIALGLQIESIRYLMQLAFYDNESTLVTLHAQLGTAGMDCLFGDQERLLRGVDCAFSVAQPGACIPSQSRTLLQRSGLAPHDFSLQVFKVMKAFYAHALLLHYRADRALGLYNDEATWQSSARLAGRGVYLFLKYGAYVKPLEEMIQAWNQAQAVDRQAILIPITAEDMSLLLPAGVGVIGYDARPSKIYLSRVSDLNNKKIKGQYKLPIPSSAVVTMHTYPIESPITNKTSGLYWHDRKRDITGVSHDLSYPNPLVAAYYSESSSWHYANHF